MPIMKKAFMGLPSSKREIMLKPWEIALPTPKKTILDTWVIKTAHLVKPPKAETSEKEDCGNILQRDPPASGGEPPQGPAHIRAKRGGAW